MTLQNDFTIQGWDKEYLSRRLRQAKEERTGKNGSEMRLGERSFYLMKMMSSWYAT